MQRQNRRWKWTQWLAAAAAAVTIAGGILEFVKVIRTETIATCGAIVTPAA